ncbi:MAG: stage V sporulation T C-terminal domain-containing protein [Lachnospiraceae bacterium]|nr:stage V sporulation T C-terminal domain-containing protein [Lachnospiraceae bacterium]
MKATGIVRRIDDLGRVVIPKEIRRTLRIREGEPLEIFTDKNGEIILKKYSPIGELAIFAKEYVEALAQSSSCLACICDQDRIIAASGPDAKLYEGKEITKELEDFISKRKNQVEPEKSSKFIQIIEHPSDKRIIHSQAIHTIICAGDAIGAVILLASGTRMALCEKDAPLAAVGASFLGKQMEN